MQTGGNMIYKIVIEELPMITADSITAATVQATDIISDIAYEKKYQLKLIEKIP